MSEKQEKQEGYTIVSYRVRLYDRHFQWLLETKKLYDKVAMHFFSVLSKEKELLEMSDFQLLRTLEILCIGTKEMKARKENPKYSLEDFPKIPLYFRRSAINAAITLARKQRKKEHYKIDGQEANTENQKIDFPMILYQGMYRALEKNKIEVKLFNGERWIWVKYPFFGKEFSEQMIHLSPMLFFEKNQAFLDIPVKSVVQDISTVKERMQTEEQICAVSFPDYEVMAVAVIMNKKGEEQEFRFFRGGKQREYQRKRILEQLEKSLESRQTKQRKSELPKENQVLYTKIRKLNSHYAHTISKQILTYCMEHNIKIIVVPNYDSANQFQQKSHLIIDTYRWIGRSIIKNLKYKAFREGIIVTSIRPVHITDCCSECGNKIKRYNEGHIARKNYYGGRLFVCSCGNSGNTAQNTAKNIGKLFLNYYKEEKDK